MKNCQSLSHRYRLDQICVFTNRGISGITCNDGKRCRIVRIKPESERTDGEPAYVIRFLDGDGHGFGVRECELEPDTMDQLGGKKR